MSKKQKRRVAAEAASAAAPASASAPKSGATGRTSYATEFNPDYSLVMKDLKKIGIMAVSFIGILVVLSFFLR